MRHPPLQAPLLWQVYLGFWIAGVGGGGLALARPVLRPAAGPGGQNAFGAVPG